MKDNSFQRVLQRRINKLGKSRGYFQRQVEKLEQNHDDNAINQTLLQIVSNDRERCLLHKLSEGAMS